MSQNFSPKNKSPEYRRGAAAAIIGTVAYMLCVLIVYRYVQYPCFLCAAAFLPVMLHGADGIIRQKSSLILILGSFGCAITTIEHFSAAAVILMIWTLLRFMKYPDLKFKDAAGNMLLILMPMLSGGLLAAFAVLPALFELITGGLRHFRFPFYDLILLPPTLIIGRCTALRCRELFGFSPRPYIHADPRHSGLCALYALISCTVLSLCGSCAPFLPGYRALYETDIRNISEIPYEFPLISSYSYYITRNDWKTLESGAQVEALHKSLILNVSEGSYLPEYDARTIAAFSDGVIVSDGSTQLEIPLEAAFSDSAPSDTGADITADLSVYEFQAVYHNLRFVPSGSGTTENAVSSAHSAEMSALSATTHVKHLAISGPDISSSRSETGAACIITYETPGTYIYDSLDIVCRSSEAVYEELWALETSGPDNIDATYVEIGGHRPTVYPYQVITTVDFDKPRLLLLKIPYSMGWKATTRALSADNTADSYDSPDYTEPSVSAAEIMRADTSYMAIQVPAGSYEIVWTYNLPLFSQGTAVSILALIWVVIWLAYEKSPKRYRYFYY